MKRSTRVSNSAGRIAFVALLNAEAWMGTPEGARFNLLREPLLHWRGADRKKHATTLPGLLHHLATGAVSDFPKARAHQYHPWCMFLAQLAFHALNQAGKGWDDRPENEEGWQGLFLQLTEQKEEAWCLVVDDPRRPAYLQPPHPTAGAHEISKWPIRHSPDALDILIVAKEHETKSGIVRPSDVEAWVYALVCVQNGGSYTKAGPAGGYWGSARSKGVSFRPRVFVAALEGPETAQQFIDDVRNMLNTAANTDEFSKNAVAKRVLWLEEWDGAKSLTLSSLAPHFLEVSRLVRLRAAGEQLEARVVGTKSRRVADVKGDAGDLWTPVERSERESMAVQQNSFDYDKVHELLFGGKWDQPVALTAGLQASGPRVFVAAGLGHHYKDTKLEKLLERRIPLSEKRRGLMATAASIGGLAQDRIAATKEMKGALRAALIALVAAGGGEKAQRDAARMLAKKKGKDLVSGFTREFESRVDLVFFDALFEDLARPPRARAVSWQKRLYKDARLVLAAAERAMPIPDARRLKAVTTAGRIFEGSARTKFRKLFAPQQEQQQVRA